MQAEFIARKCGCSLPEFETLLAELFHAQVPSRHPDGTIFSRRMVRDEKALKDDAKRQRKHRRKEGKKEVVYNHDDVTDDVTEMSHASSSSSSSSSSEERNRRNVPAEKPRAPPRLISQGETRTEWKPYFAYFYDSWVIRKRLNGYKMPKKLVGILAGLYDSYGPARVMALWDLWWASGKPWTEYGCSRGHSMDVFADRKTIDQLLDDQSLKERERAHEQKLGLPMVDVGTLVKTSV